MTRRSAPADSPRRASNQLIRAGLDRRSVVRAARFAAGVITSLLALSSFVAADQETGASDSAAPVTATSPERKTSPERAAPAIARVFPLAAFSADRRSIHSGLRVERRGTSAVVVARERLPAVGEASFQELPGRLGGGYLFLQPSGSDGSSTALFRAESFTGDLTPLATVEFTARRVEAGFDRLYVIGSDELIALDAWEGRGTTLDPLPPAAAYERPRFGPGFTAAVEVPLVGVLATFDGGTSWRPVPGARSILPEGDGIRLITEDGAVALTPEGTLLPIQTRKEPRPEDEMFVSAPLPEDNLLLRAILGGAALGRERAALLTEGDLVTVSLVDGESLERQRDVTDRTSTCRGLSWGKAAAFFCVGERSTSVLRLHEGRLRRMFEFPGRRRLLSSTDGALLLSGSCQTPDTRVCHVLPASARTLPALPEGALPLVTGKEVHLIQPPRRRAGKKLAPLRVQRNFPRGPQTSIRLPEDEEVRQLLVEGDWLPGAFSLETSVGTWVTAGERYVGVLVTEDGQLNVGPVQSPVRRALLHSRYALSWGGAGHLRQTTDGGQSWQTSSLPFRVGDPDPMVPGPYVSRVIGCSTLGCVIGGYLRVGWDAEGAEQPVAAVPREVVVPGSGIRSWSLECGESGTRSDSFRNFVSFARRDDDWPGFLEVEAPIVAASEVGYTLGSYDEQARAYTWGPRKGSWGAGGQLEVVWNDPHHVEGTRRSKVVVPPYSDAHAASKAFGGDTTAGASRAFSALDPSGEAGLMILRSPVDKELIAFAEGRPPEFFQGVSELELDSLSSAVSTPAGWYFLQLSSYQVRLFHARGGQVRLLREYPYAERSSAGAVIELVRTVRGDAIGLLTRTIDGMRIIYPVDQRTGDLGDPMTISQRRWESPTIPCAPDVPGYLAAIELAFEPWIDSLKEANLGAVRARVLLNQDAICVESLATVVGEFPHDVRSTKPSASAPLVVTERRAGGRRHELLCH